MNKKTTIYIADDDDDDRLLVRDALESVIPHAVIIEAVDGSDLLRQIEQDEFHEGLTLVLIDMNMPKIGGLDALARIRSDKRIQHLPVIMLSTASSSELIKAAYHQGINAYITKPVLVEDYVQIAEAVNVCFFNNHNFSAEQAVVKDLSKKNILVIEDNADHRELINFALHRSIPKINVVGMNDEQSTLEFLSNQWESLDIAPQLILLDLYLPTRQDGLNLLATIRKFLFDRQLDTVPIIMVSHSNDPMDIRECYRQQANAYMIKSPDFSSWVQYFSHLCHFWIDTIVLPKAA